MCTEGSFIWDQFVGSMLQKCELESKSIEIIFAAIVILK